MTPTQYPGLVYNLRVPEGMFKGGLQSLGYHKVHTLDKFQRILKAAA